jgi:ornithine decarboxylase
VKIGYPNTLEALHAITSSRRLVASSFYAISQRRVQQQLQTWYNLLPTVRPYYAVKCNPEPYLLEWLMYGGAGFDCASQREVDCVLRNPAALTGLQRRTPDIVFANPCKKRGDIISSSISGIQTTVVDSHEEIDKLSEIGWKGESLVRVRVEDKGSKMPFSAKFGLELDAVENLSKYAKIKGQKLSGISFHVGSGCEAPEQYGEAIRQSISALGTITKSHKGANCIDIGGGFTPCGTGSKFVDAALEIYKWVKFYPTVKFIAEPGRFFAQTSHDLFVRVIGKKPARTAKGGWRYTLDESLYGQFSCIPFDHAQPKWVRVREPGEAQRKKTPAVLYGRTCDSVDFIAAAEQTEELEEGDTLWFPHMGAYTTVTSTEFNGFPKPPSLILEAHRDLQLPEPEQFPESEWPRGLKYASAVEVPKLE